MRRTSLYRIGVLGWITVVIAAGALLFGGIAPIAPADVPGGEPAVVVAVIVVAFVGSTTISLLGSRAWRTANRDAGLEPVDGGYLSTPSTFVGTVGGRTVRVEESTDVRGTHSVHDGGRKSETFTVVETELSRPVADGVLVQQAPTRDGGVSVDVTPDVGAAAPDDLDLEVLGSPSADLAERLRSGRPREAIEALDYVGEITIGDATTAMAESIPDDAKAFLEGFGEDVTERIEEDGEMDPAMVAHRTAGRILDGEELRRQIEAVVAIAEAVDRTAGADTTRV